MPPRIGKAELWAATIKNLAPNILLIEDTQSSDAHKCCNG